ncbi:MAG TPA: PEP-CTERM sorting domain-containing protein [Rhizomicrobium sp.]|jgi:hypothetical protein
MKSLWASALVMGALLAGLNTASADMCKSDWRDQNCVLDASAAWAGAPFSSGLFTSGSLGRTPGNLSGATLEGSTTDPTGINGLVVDGKTYNVTFSLTNLNSFTEGTTISIDADTALTAALNTFKVTALDGHTGNGYYDLNVDNSTSNFDTSVLDAGKLPWRKASCCFGFSLPLGCSSSPCVEAADFTPADVPEPGTIGLFGAALLALGVLGLRRKVV